MRARALQTTLFCLALAAAFAPPLVLSQGGEGGEGGEGTDIGANPPNALIGCGSPYTYLEANARAELSTFHSLVEGDQDIKEAQKYRNFTGTLLLPTNAAFDKLAQTAGIQVLNEGVLTTSALQAILEYHTLLDPIDPTTLAAQQGSQTYETALSLNPTGGNAKLDAPVWELFVRNPTLTYETVNITVAPAAASSGENAPPGTYVVAGAASQANIIWDTNNQPVRTCAAYIYLIDTVLLPGNDLSALNAGGSATAPLAQAGESEGASVEVPTAG